MYTSVWKVNKSKVHFQDITKGINKKWDITLTKKCCKRSSGSPSLVLLEGQWGCRNDAPSHGTAFTSSFITSSTGSRVLRHRVRGGGPAVGGAETAGHPPGLGTSSLLPYWQLYSISLLLWCIMLSLRGSMTMFCTSSCTWTTHWLQMRQLQKTLGLTLDHVTVPREVLYRQN